RTATIRRLVRDDVHETDTVGELERRVLHTLRSFGRELREHSFDIPFVVSDEFRLDLVAHHEFLHATPPSALTADSRPMRVAHSRDCTRHWLLRRRRNPGYERPMETPRGRPCERRPAPRGNVCSRQCV